MRLGFVVLIVLGQFNFLNLLFGNVSGVNLSILAVIAWVIISGFEKTWIWIILLGILNDVFLSDRIGPDIIFFIVLAYAVSFLSRSFIIERKLSGFLVVAFFIVAATFLGEMFIPFFSGKIGLENFWENIKKYFLDWRGILIKNFLAGIFFYLIYNLIRMIEKYIGRADEKLKINL